MTTATVDASTFLPAVLSATQDPFLLVYGDTTADLTTFSEVDAILTDAGDDTVYLSPIMSTGAIPFLYSFTENAQRDQWRDDVLAPTAVLFKDDALICIYALETAVDRATADPVAQAMNGFLDDPIPLPGAWELVHLDDKTFHPFEALADLWSDQPPAVVEPVEFGTLNDATLLTPFRLDDPRYLPEITVSVGGNAESKVWAPKPMPVWTFVDMLSRHREDKKKDGLAFVLAEIVGNQRKKAAVKACYGVGLDIDVGVSGALIDEALLGLGCLAVRYTTHSHAKTSTKLLKDRIAKWCKKHDLAEGVTQDTIVRFLREESRWDESIIATVEYVDDVHDPEGFMVQLDHIPMPKHRIVLPLAVPFIPTAVAATHDAGMKMWGDVCRALAKALGDLPLDRSAVDPSRLFYFPRHVAARPFETRIVGGDLLDWKSLDLDGGDAERGSFEALLEAEVKTTERTKSKSTTDAGRDLGRWSTTHAGRFQIVDLIKDHAEDRIRTNGAHKIDIECPFDEEHSDPGNTEDKGCFAVNAGDGDAPVFVVRCQHDACTNRTNLDHLGKMLRDEWFDQAALDDATYYSESDDETVPTVVKGASAGPITIAEIANLTSQATQEEVEAVAARIARLGSVERARATKALGKATGIDAATAKALIKDAVTSAVERPAEPAAALKPLLDAIPLPSAAHGDFTVGTFDGKPWVYETVGEKGAARRLYTPWGVKGGAVYMDRDHRVGLRLAMLAGGTRLTEIDVPATMMADGKAFRAELIARGIALTPDGGERAAELIAQFQPSQPIAVYDRPGWRSKDVFITPWNEAIGEDADAPPKVALAGTTVPKGDAKGGSLQGWIDATASAFALGMVQMQLSALAAFASPLIDLCNYESRTLFLSGGAGRGKSTGHLIQTSAWGDPTPKAGLFGTFDTTANAPEVCLAQGSGAGVAFDEVKVMRGGDLQRFLFMIWSGAGKTRMDYRSSGLKETALWRCLFVASYEDPLATKIRADGDQIMPGLGARVLEVTVNGVELKPELIPAVEAVKTNFGWAGPAFIRALFDQGWVEDPSALRQAIEAKADALLAFERSDQRRSAQTAAILWQAGEIAQEAGLIPGVFPLAPAPDMLLDGVVVETDDEAIAIEADNDLERLMKGAWRNATQADSAATDTTTKAVDTLIRNLVTGLGVTVAEGPDGSTRDRQAFRLDMFKAPGAGVHTDVYVVPLQTLSKLTESPVEAAKIAKALESRDALLLYPRAPGRDGRTRKGERVWTNVPGIGQVKALVIPAKALE